MPQIDLTSPINRLSHSTFSEKEVSVFMIRLDQIHPHISGNKLYKLYYFLQQCLQMEKPSLVTFGGPYSNHLAACAFAAQLYHIAATGIVRGERPDIISPTLQFCEQCGMQLQFVSRAVYKDVRYSFNQTDSVVIPEGGYHTTGIKGASLIMDQIQHLKPSHIITPVGSATTMAGLLLKVSSSKIIAVPALKKITDIPQRLAYLQVNNLPHDIWNDFHFGGFGKHTPELISFMNEFYKEHNIPLDFVYTAKMMYGVMEKIQQDYFEKGSIIACIHTGGLQGNSSIQNQIIFDV